MLILIEFKGFVYGCMGGGSKRWLNGYLEVTCRSIFFIELIVLFSQWGSSALRVANKSFHTKEYGVCEL